ncbi:MAG: ABC transporter ATP-binding protein [Acidobacteriota bacterium]
MGGSRALEVQDLAKTYGSGTRRPVAVLENISFQMAAGEALAITGPSGSGKSTLLHLLGTLDRPTSGRILWEGREPHLLPERDLASFRNRSIGFVFQDPCLLPQYSVLENVLIPARAFGRGRPEIRDRARRLIDRVGLTHRIGHRPAELSGGERQRTAVARALINGPGLLLCDEPTGSLDGGTAEQVGALLLELHRQEKNVLIIVTHNLELAGRLPRRLELAGGRCSAV